MTKQPTKKELKAAAVEEAKRVAYVRRVRNLTGQLVGERMDVGAALTAYKAGTTADAYAAELASREPVGRVVHPLKADAIKAAENKARATVERVRADLEKHGWDLNAAAPYPWGMSAWSHDYKPAKAKSSLYGMLTEDKPGANNRHRANNEDPCIVQMSERGVSRFVEMATQEAAFQYDAFICKLVSKIGDCVSAELTGSHVWAHSILTVRKGDTVEKWKTQQIWNVSKLGNEFPQWPTRLMKR